MSRRRGSPKVPDSWNPALPHPDEKRERFAVSVAQGGALSACYRSHVAKPDAKATSIKSAAWLMLAEDPVKQRVEFMRRHIAEGQDVDESPLTSAELRALMEEVSTILEICHRTGRMSGVGSIAQLTRIERATIVHVGRLSRSTKPHAKKATSAVHALDTDALPWCTCGDTRD